MNQSLTKTAFFCTAVLCIAMLGCTSPQPEPETVAEPETSQDTTETPSAYLKSLQGIKSAPRNDVETTAALTEFQTAYGSFPQVKVRLHSDLIGFLQLHPGTPDNGLVFHYGLTDNPLTIHYIIGPGVMDPTTELFTAGPFPANSNGQSAEHYILLDAAASNAAFRYIDHTEYCQLTDYYHQNMRMTTGGVTDYVRNDPNHPYLIYHEGSELNQFYQDNAGLNPTHFYLAHGADNRNPTATKYHVPYLMFGDDTKPFDLASDNDPTYLRKALDIGRPCPPFCGNSVLPSAICP